MYTYIQWYISCETHMKCRSWYENPQEILYMRWDTSQVITDISHEKYEISYEIFTEKI